MMPEWWTIDGRGFSGIPFALDGSGNWVDVDAVPRGKACSCICPECRGPVVARQGDVRVHHFAHADRRECRYALETALFGMAMTIFRDPDARIAVPAVGESVELLRQAGIDEYQPELDDILPSDPLIDRCHLYLRGAALGPGDIAQSTRDVPEVSFAQESVFVHLLSRQKGVEQIERADTAPGARVLGINLQAYARGWWEICAPVEDLGTVVQNATEGLRTWLAQSFSGRGWVRHPLTEEKLRELGEFSTHRKAVRNEEQRRIREDLDKRKAEAAALAPTVDAKLTVTLPRANARGDGPPFEVARRGIGVCKLCGGQKDEVLYLTGMFSGKRAEQCRDNPRHPLKML